jgi:hypothetical protein
VTAVKSIPSTLLATTCPSGSWARSWSIGIRLGEPSFLGKGGLRKAIDLPDRERSGSREDDQDVAKPKATKAGARMTTDPGLTLRIRHFVRHPDARLTSGAQ